MTDSNRSDLARRTVLGITGVGILGLGAVSGSVANEHDDGDDDNGGAETKSGGYDVDEILDDWDEEATKVAETVIETHGEPDEVVPSRLIWHQEDDETPWKRTEMFRDPVPHNFPVEHPDYLEQFIDLHIPPDQYDDVASYDGSVMLERTKGEVSARCDKEAMNFLAVNLTHELVHSDIDVEEARRMYAEDAMAFMDGEEPPRTQDIQFELPEGDQRDPDVTIVKDGEIEPDRDEGPKTDEGDETSKGNGESDDESENGNSESDESECGNGEGDNATETENDDE